MLRTLALIALAPALAFARTTVSRDVGAGAPEETREDSTTIVLGAAGPDISIDKLRVVIAAPDDGARAVRIVLALSTASTERRQAVLPIGLSRGARIIGAAVQIGNEPRMAASVLAPEAARTEYQDLFRVHKDPLLVELADRGDAHAIPDDAFDPASHSLNAFLPAPPPASDRTDVTNYVVRAFPLTDRDRALVELTIELPADAARLSISPAQRLGTVEVQRTSSTGTPGLDLRRRRDVRGPIAMDLPPARVLPVSVAKLAERPHVDATQSLYAGFAPTVVERGRAGAIPTVTIDHAYGGHRYWSVDKTIIRRMVKQHIAQLARCYTKVTEYRGGPEGTAVMHFFIEPSGRISNVFVDGELDDPRITDCLADQVVQWQFSPGDGGVVVHYPLHFRIAE